MTKIKNAKDTALDEDAFVKGTERRFRSLADAIPLIVWTANPNGELDYYNQQWEIYTGFTAEETQGWGWAPVLHPDDLQRCIDKWTKAFTTGELYEIEYRFKRAADGAYRWHLGRAIPFRDESGTIIKGRRLMCSTEQSPCGQCDSLSHLPRRALQCAPALFPKGPELWP